MTPDMRVTHDPNNPWSLMTSDPTQAKLYRDNVSAARRLDQKPSASELEQYRLRFSELYDNS